VFLLTSVMDVHNDLGLFVGHFVNFGDNGSASNKSSGAEVSDLKELHPLGER